MTIFSSILPDLVDFTLKSATLHLQLARKIGSGAYGIVYLAEDVASPSTSPRVYAVKHMLKFEPGSELEAMQQREIAYHRSLNHHPNVTKLHCVIEEQHYIFLVMDYYEGGDLFAAVIDRQSFAGDDARVKSGFVQLLDAVDACHELGVFHRDLKPENILCSSDDSHFFLSDFGLATQLEISSSLRCGSSFYMSPGTLFISRPSLHKITPRIECIGIAEQPTPYSTRQSDIWSLGVILVNMLTGRNPWRTASIDDDGYCMYLHSTTHFLHQILPMISTDAVEILARIFDPDPTTRISIPELRQLVLATSTFFANAEEYAEDFKLLTETFPDSVKGQSDVTVVDVELCSTGSDDTASTAAFVSVYIRTPSAETTADDFFGAMHSRSSGRDVPCTDSPSPYTLTAQAAVKPEGQYVGRDVHVRKGRVRGAKGPRTVRRIMEAFYRRAART